ncbi:MAG: glycosyltransferase family 2 protein, partial [Acidimicrobiia bacterium]|nr:glycosyltransferase family 2 protein [Acidimicrobiia bacterium]
PLDEGLKSTREHLDLCLQTHAAGGKVWFEPASLVTYVAPPPVDASDVPYFMLRWSEAWNVSSLNHFCDKYGLDDSYKRRLGIMRARRQVVFDPLRKVTRTVLDTRGDAAFGKVLGRAEREVNKLVVRAG